MIETDKIDNEDQSREGDIDSENNESTENQNEVPSDSNAQEYLYNEKADDDEENSDSNLLNSEVRAVQQSQVSNILKIVDSDGNVIEGIRNESEEIIGNTGTDNTDRCPEYCDPDYRMPGIITVRVTQDLEEYKFQVIIVKAISDSKIYLGATSFIHSFIHLFIYSCSMPSKQCSFSFSLPLPISYSNISSI